MMRYVTILIFSCLSFVLPAQLRYEVKPLSVNTSQFNEYAAVSYGNGIVFCSDRKTVFTPVAYSPAYNGTFTTVYYSGNKNGSWSSPELFSRELHSDLNNGPVCFSADQSSIIYSSNQMQEKPLKDSKAENPLGLFFSEKQNNHWKNGTQFQYNNIKVSFAQPCLSADGNHLYFVSNAPEGFGGTDIYVCDKSATGWSEPRNLGKEINTAGNEMFPFIHSNGKLYFSSTGHNSKGGLDIFYSKQTIDGWLEPKAMSEPVNSDLDDFAYSSDQKDQKGFFSSNRMGTDDIFEFNYPWPEFEKCDSLKQNNHCFVFFQEDKPNDSIPVNYEWVLGDGSKEQGLEVEHCYKKAGVYHVELNVIDQESKKVFYNEASYDVEVVDAIQPFITAPDTIMINSAIAFNAIESNLPDFGAHSYYWDFGDGLRDTGTVMKHVYASAGLFPVYLGAVSESKQKACAVKYIYVSPNTEGSAKENAERIRLASEKKKEGDLVYSVEVKLSKEPLGKNNEVFDKLKSQYVLTEKYVESANLYTYSVGDAKSLKEVYPIYKDVQDKGYTDAIVKSDENNVISLDQALELESSVLKKKIIRLVSTQFASGSADLEADGFYEITKLMRLMQKNPDIKVHISAHTDNDGTEDDNVALSLKRANTIVNYLVSKGIAADRVRAEGFGESQPIASNNTPEGKKKNRRVEISIIQ